MLPQTRDKTLTTE
jgi:hypothetical protein